MDEKRLVLLVEDDEGLRRKLAQFMGRSGLNVLQAGSGESALKVAEETEGSIPVVVMDINLPDAWGASLAQSIRGLHPEIEVIYITGAADEDPVLKGALNDAHRVLLKPFDPDVLIELVEEILGGPR